MEISNIDKLSRKDTTMIKQLFLIRHGEAEHMIKGMTGGWTDTSLTEKGEIDAHLAADLLADIPDINHCKFYSSDLKRASETASIIAEKIRISPLYTRELRERNNGKACGLTLQEAGKIRNPENVSFIDYVVYPEGESFYTMYCRLKVFLEKLNSSEDESFLIVSHSNAITAIINWWLEFDREMMSRISYHISECSLTQLGINRRNQKIIVRLNSQ